MKKLLTILLAVCTVTLSSCKKDDSTIPDSLNGTSWTTAMPDNGGTMTLVFSENTVKGVAEYEGEIFSEISGTYIYKAPNVTITFDDTSSTGVVEGNKMTLNSPDGSKMTLTKK